MFKYINNKLFKPITYIIYKINKLKYDVNRVN